MNLALIVDNLLSPPILFFFLGILAIFVHSDLELPPQISKFLSLYLLFAIGFKGGYSLHTSGLTSSIVMVLVVAILLSACVPIYSFFVLRRRLSFADAAAIAATYGSVSAVTFITAVDFLQTEQVAYSGYMVAAMALMESPAIIVAVIFYRFFGTPKHMQAESNGFGKILHEALFNGSVFLLLGSLAIGWLTGEDGYKAVSPFTDGIFRGMLTFFLLDMGMTAGRRMGDMRNAGTTLVAFALITPLVNAALAILLAKLLALSVGDALLLTILAASASYIAVPAALRLTIPEANPGLYLTTALGITFPFNIIIGMPIYLALIEQLW